MRLTTSMSHISLTPGVVSILGKQRQSEQPLYSDLLKECTFGNIQNVETILENCKKEGKQIDTQDSSPLIMAASKGHLEIVKILLNNGFDLVKFSATGKTALHYACGGGNTETVKYILENGPPLNSSFYQKYNPLFQAAEFGHVEVVKLLLEHTEKVSVKFHYQTPIYIATKRGHYKVVRELLEHGERLEVARGFYPIHMAFEIRNPELVQIFAFYGVNINDRGKTYQDLWKTKTKAIEEDIEDINEDKERDKDKDRELYISLLHFWTPQNHFLHPKAVREVLITVLLVAKRQKWILDKNTLLLILSFVAFDCISLLSPPSSGSYNCIIS